MQKVIFFTVLNIMFFLISCSQEEEKSETPEIRGNSAINHPRKDTLRHGVHLYEKNYYPNGSIKTEGNTLEGKRDGKWMSWHENGMPWSETWFENGIKQGATTVWHPNGMKYYEGKYNNGEPSGTWTYWDENGNLTAMKEY